MGTEGGHSTCNQVILLHFVLQPTFLVCKANTGARYVAAVSPPEQIPPYMENLEPHIEIVKWDYIW